MSKEGLYIETYGLNGLEQYFKNLSVQDRSKIVLSSFRKATKPLVEQAKSNAPKGKTHNLERSIGFVGIRDTMPVSAIIGARIRRGYKGYIGLIVDGGTFDRKYITKNGIEHHTGRMKVSNFFRKAADATEQQAINTVADEWHKTIARFAIRKSKDK
jgi:hypothetical protein